VRNKQKRKRVLKKASMTKETKRCWRRRKNSFRPFNPYLLSISRGRSVRSPSCSIRSVQRGDNHRYHHHHLLLLHLLLSPTSLVKGPWPKSRSCGESGNDGKEKLHSSSSRGCLVGVDTRRDDSVVNHCPVASQPVEDQGSLAGPRYA
jgi:predicted transcriptional regulator with HTH domain